MGKMDSSNSLPFLTQKEEDEFDKIGYTGKDNKERPCSYHEFLNRIGKGEFKVRCMKPDMGDFCETFEIIRYVDEDKPAEKVNEMPHVLMTPDEKLTDIAKKLADLSGMPYCWEDVRGRLINGFPLPFNFKTWK